MCKRMGQIQHEHGHLWSMISKTIAPLLCSGSKNKMRRMALTQQFINVSSSADAVQSAVEAANTEGGGGGINLCGSTVTVEASWLEVFIKQYVQVPTL